MGVVHEIEFKSLVNTTYFDKFKVNYRTADNGDLVIEDPTGAAASLSIRPDRPHCQAPGQRIPGALSVRRRRALPPQSPCAPQSATSYWMHGYGYSGAGDLVVVSDTPSRERRNTVTTPPIASSKRRARTEPRCALSMTGLAMSCDSLA